MHRNAELTERQGPRMKPDSQEQRTVAKTSKLLNIIVTIDRCRRRCVWVFVVAVGCLLSSRARCALFMTIPAWHKVYNSLEVVCNDRQDFAHHGPPGMENVFTV